VYPSLVSGQLLVRLVDGFHEVGRGLPWTEFDKCDEVVRLCSVWRSNRHYCKSIRQTVHLNKLSTSVPYIALQRAMVFEVGFSQGGEIWEIRKIGKFPDTAVLER